MALAATKKATVDTETKSPKLPEDERIAALAYALWEARGYPQGSPEVDWFQAEKELTAAP